MLVLLFVALLAGLATPTQAYAANGRYRYTVIYGTGTAPGKYATKSGFISAGNPVKVQGVTLEGYGNISSTTNHPEAYNNHTFSMPLKDVTVTFSAKKLDGSILTLNKGEGIASVLGDGFVAWGATVRITATPVPGYRFDSWHSETGGLTPSDPTSASATITMPHGPAALTATAVPDDFRVTVDPNGAGAAWDGQSDPTEIVVTYGSTAPRLSEGSAAGRATMPGHVFNGLWSTPSDSPQQKGILIIGADGAPVSKGSFCMAANGTWTRPFNTTLYARWRPISYSIAYDLDGGTMNTTYKPATATYGKTLLIATPTRKSYTFTGWTITGMDEVEHFAADADGWLESLGASQSATGIIKSSFLNLRSTPGTVTFTATWAPITHRLSITYDTGTRAGEGAAESSEAVLLGSSIYVRGELTGGDYAAVEPMVRGTTVPYDQFHKVKNGSTIKMPDRDVEIIYTAIPSRFAVTYYANGGTGAPAPQEKLYGKRLTLSKVTPTRENETVEGFSVTLDANGGTVSPSVVTAQNIATFTFNGWSKTPDGTRSYNAGGLYSPDAPLDLYAVWMRKIKKMPVELPTPTREGYAFVGWGTTRTTKKAVASNYVPPKDVTLYAIWASMHELVVNYGDGTQAGPNATPASVNVVAGSTVNVRGVVLKGYEKIKVTRDGKSISNNTSFKMPEADVTLNFSATQKSYKVTFAANGGTGAPAAQDKLYGEPLTLSETVPTRQDGTLARTVKLNANGGKVSPSSLKSKSVVVYHFAGWATSAKGTPTFAAGDTYTKDAQLKLYAIWKEEILPADPVELPTPTRKGYDFAGWATSKAAKSGVTGSYVPPQNVTLYATWIA